MVAPESAIPVGAVVVTVPPHTVAEAFATVRPTGRVSVKATPVRAIVLEAGLVMVNCNVVVAVSAIAAGVKDLAIDGGATTEVLAEAVAPVPPSVEVTAAVVLFCRPAEIPVTLIEKVQEALDARVAPERLMAAVPCVAVMVPPPQVPERPFGVEITKPAGNVSLKAAFESEEVVLLF